MRRRRNKGIGREGVVSFGVVVGGLFEKFVWNDGDSLWRKDIFCSWMMLM